MMRALRTKDNPAVAALLALVLLAALASGQADEATYYAYDNLTPPEGAVLEVGGLDFLPDGRLALGTRRGQVWIVENPLAANPADAKFKLFAEGLVEILGLSVVDGEIVVLQRTEISRLRDEDGDGGCDHIDTICDDWGVSGNYHEFCFGLPRDDAGNLYITLNVAFDSPWWLGKAPAPYRGWMLKIAPDGKMTPFASGLRSPCGVGRNSKGDLFVTDNQGDWVASCPIYAMKEGGFYGHPASLQWLPAWRSQNRVPSLTDAPDVERTPAAIWIPYEWSRSTGNLVEDETGGKFGPTAGQLILAEMTNGLVLRAQTETVRGETQGWTTVLRRGIGSAARVAFAKDGTLFIGRTNRGWGGQKPDDGIGRVRFTGRMPMEIQDVKVRDDGFLVRFTEPLADDFAPKAADVLMRSHTYNYWWEYGSPETNQKPIVVESVEVAPDRSSIVVKAPLEVATVVRLDFKGFRSKSGQPLLHSDVAYTVNNLPSKGRDGAFVNIKIKQPPPRETGDEGIAFLMHQNPLDAWQGSGWKPGKPKLSTADATRLEVEEYDPAKDKDDENKDPNRHVPGPRWIADVEADPTNLVCRFPHGDVSGHVDFMLAKGAKAGVVFQGRYEIVLTDRDGDVTLETCGAIAKAPDVGSPWPGRSPTFNAYRGEGHWHSLDFTFTAPKFDAAGKKTQDACFRRVMIDDTLLHENVWVPAATSGAIDMNEVAAGPLVLRGSPGGVAFGQARLKPIDLPDDERGWTSIFNGRDLEGWKISDGGQWKVEEGMIVGSGKASHLFSPRGDYKNFEFRALAKINEGGNSGMYFRTAYGPGWPSGYEAQVNSTNRDPVKTGSLYNHVLVKTRLVPANTWFEQRIRCVDEKDGAHVTIWVNGLRVVDFVDKEKKFAAGHFALQQHHEGSEVRYKDLLVRELP